MRVVNRKRYLARFEWELVFKSLWPGQIVGCKHWRRHGSRRREWVVQGVPLLAAILAVVGRLILIIVLLTCKVDSTVLAARERGAYVAVFTCHRVNHPGIPPGEVTWNSNEERLMPADVASTVVESAIPWGKSETYNIHGHRELA